MVTLGCNNLVVVLSPQGHAKSSPGVEVSSDVDRSAGAVVLANGPVLLEGRCAINGRLVGAGGFKNGVCAAINGDRALGCCCGRGVICSETLNDVVLDQGAPGPAVD